MDPDTTTFATLLDQLRQDLGPLCGRVREVEPVCEALDARDAGAALQAAERILDQQPVWTAAETAFNALLAVRAQPGADLQDLERILEALPDREMRGRTLAALEHRDWHALERALHLDDRQRAHVYCHHVRQMLAR